MNSSDRAIFYDDLAINFSVYMCRTAEEYEWFSFQYPLSLCLSDDEHPPRAECTYKTAECSHHYCLAKPLPGWIWRYTRKVCSSYVRNVN